jgi:hypothetical protein
MPLPPDTDSPEEAAPVPPGPASSEAVIAALQAHNAELQTLIGALQARIAELERQLGLNSSNSGKPRNLRERSGKRTGGQKGHPGETLRRTATPDATVDHYPQICAAGRLACFVQPLHRALTTTDTGLKVCCEIDANLYPKGVTVTDSEMHAINITHDEFHGEWNYTISPNQQPP